MVEQKESMKLSKTWLRSLVTPVTIVMCGILGLFISCGIFLRSLDGSCSVIHEFSNGDKNILTISKCWFDDGFYTNYDAYRGEEHLIESAYVVLGSNHPERLELQYTSSSATALVAVTAPDEPYDPLIILDFSTGETWARRGDGARNVLQKRLEEAYPQFRVQAQLHDTAYLQPRWSLDLSYKTVGGNDLLLLRHHQQIKHLDLANTGISDADMSEIGQLTFLCSLDLSGTQISDDGIPLLHPLGNLAELDIAETSISDAAIPFFQSFTTLRTLMVKDTRITEDGEKRLQTLLPHVEISHSHID
jgi:hypothetical protein